MPAKVVAPATKRRRGPGRPAGGHTVSDRPAILAAAERAIEQHGVGVTLDEIAAAAAVSKPIVYRLVGDRDALVMALSESLVDRIDAAVTAATSADRSPRDAFAAAVQTYLESVAANRSLYLFVNAGGHRTEAYRQLVERSAASLIAVFRAARPGADSSHGLATTWAHAIIGAFQTVTVMWLDDDPEPVEQVAANLTALLWPGVATLNANSRPERV